MVKLSMTLFIKELVPIHAHARIAHLFGAGVLIWGLGSEFAAAFQCNGPRTWHKEGNACFNIVSLEVSDDSMAICLSALVGLLELIQYHQYPHRCVPRPLAVNCDLQASYKSKS